MFTQTRALSAIVGKDVALALRRPVVLAVTALPPMILLLVLVLQAASITAEPVAVVNLDSGHAARVFQDTATNFDGFHTSVESPAVADADYQNLRVAAVITIPAGFSAGLAAGAHPAIGWQVRNFNADSTNDLQRGIADVLATFFASGAAGPNPIHLSIAEHDLHQPDADFVAFQAIAVLVLLLLQAGLINAGLAAALEWETGSVKELLLAPPGKFILVLGKVLAGTLAADVAGCLFVLIATLVGWLPAPTPALALAALAVMTLLGLFGSAIGVALASTLRSVERINPVSAVVSFYLFFLAGGIAAVAYLPGWLLTISRIVPNSYGVDALRNSLLYHSADNLSTNVTALVAAAAVMLVIGTLTMRRGLAH